VARRPFTDPAFVKDAGDAAPADEAPAATLPTWVRVFVGLARYGLVAFLLYFGALTVTRAGAAAMQAPIAHSPILSWLLATFTAEDTARIFGAVQVAAAVLILARPLSRGLCIAGSTLAILIFAATLSLLFTTPGSFAFAPDVALPLPSAAAAFLLKDVFLLIAAVASLAEAAGARR
jgi:reactive chlorine resistance protein C